MGAIAAGTSFGQDVAQPRLLSEAAIPRAAFGVVDNLHRIGQQQETEARAEMTAIDEARALRVNTDAEFDLSQAQADVVTRLRSGQIQKEEVSSEWEAKVSDIRAKALGDTPESRRRISADVFESRARRFTERMHLDVREFERDGMRADLRLTLVNLAQANSTDRAGAVATAQTVVKHLGPAAGYSLAEQQELVIKFRAAAAETDARKLVFMARDSEANLAAAAQRLGSEEFADLNPNSRLVLERQLEARRQYLQHQDAAAQARVETQARAEEAALYGKAQLQVETQGRVDPELWIQLKDGHRASLLQRQQAEARQRRAEAEGRPVRTDWKLYLGLREQALADPQRFAVEDLRQYVDRIGGAQLEQLADLRMQVVKGLGKAPRDAVTLSQQLNATMQALRMTRPADKGKFVSFVQAEVDQGTQAKGKPLTYLERQQIIDKAVLQGPDPDAWFYGTKRYYELSPEQRQRFKPTAAADAPATEVDALNEALARQGLAQTPANRLQLYQRAVNKGNQ